MDELQVYDDLIQLDIGKYEERIDGLEQHINKLNDDIQTLCTKMIEMRETQISLVANISALYKTAKNEIERKDRMIAQLRKEKDDILFRKGNSSGNKRPYSRSRSKSRENKRSKCIDQIEHFDSIINKPQERISEEKERNKPKEMIRKNEQESSRGSKEKEQEKKNKDHNKQININPRIIRQDKELNFKKSKDGENFKSKDKNSSNHRNSEHITLKSNKDTDKCKVKQDDIRNKHTEANRKTPRTNHAHSNHQKREGESKLKSSSSIINNSPKSTRNTKQLPIDLRDKLTMHSSTKYGHKTCGDNSKWQKGSERSVSSDKVNKKQVNYQSTPKPPKSSIKTGKTSKSKELLKDKDIEEGEIIDDANLVIISNTADVAPSANCTDNTDLEVGYLKLNLPAEEIPNIIKTSDFESNVPVKEFVTNTFSLALNPASIVIKNTDIAENITETKINEDNIVELHIHPKSNENENGTDSTNNYLTNDSLLTQLEEMETPVILKSSDCDQNNENINTSNLDLVIVDEKTTISEAPTNIRRRRRAIVFIS